MHTARTYTFLFNTLSQPPIQWVPPFSLGDKAVGVFNWPLTSIQLSMLKDCLDVYLHTPHFFVTWRLRRFFYLLPIY